MSAFYDQASLVMVPSGYKDGKLYSQKPLSTSGELAFSRGSDIEATRVNANGYIEKAQVNLLLQSNTFNTTWATTSATLTSGQAGYDGTNDAWLLEAFSSGTYRRISQNTNVNAVMTNSIYAKAGTVDFIGVSDTSGSTNNIVYFDLANGVIHSITNAGQIIDAQIESVGGGWYRCSAALTGNTLGTALWFVSATGGSNSNAGDNVYIQDAAQCYGLVAQTYQETTTAAVVSGITDNMPRLNYDPANPTCPSLLLEPSRTNLIVHSEYTDGANWTNEGLIVDEENTSETTSPEGVYNAVKLVSDNATSEQWIQATGISVTSGSDCTVSCFVKKSDYDYFHIRFTGIGGAFSAGSIWFNIANGTLGTAQTGITGAIQDYGNGWFRISATKEVIGTGNAGIRFQLASSDNTNAVVGDGSKGTFVYGFQAELGSYPTSYIPTYGSSATRTAEKGQKTSISALFGATATTLFLDFVKKENALGWTITGGNGTKLFSLCQFDAGNPTKPRIVFDDGVDTGGTLSAISNGRHKLAVSYSTNDTRVYIDGTLVLTDTSCTYYQMDRVGVNATAWTGFTNNTNAFELNQFLLIPSATSNADLATLTTL